MIGHRRAAVALHELHEDDRNWILGELPPADRTALEEFLAELKALGFATDQSISADTSALAAAGTGDPAPAERIRRATVAQMAGLLDAEPSALVARLLAIDDWPWGAGYVASVSEARAERLRALASVEMAVAPAAANFLLEEVATRLQQGSDAERKVAVGQKAKTGAATRVAAFIASLSTRKSWTR